MKVEEILLLAVLLAAAIWDIKARKVPNILIFAAFSVGIFMKDPGFAGRCLIIWLGAQPLCRRKYFGGGDVKLFGILAGFLGFHAAGICLVAAAGCAGVSILAEAFAEKNIESGGYPFAAAVFAGYAGYLLWLKMFC